MREIIRNERLIRLERFIKKIESVDVPPHLVGRWAKTLVELYLGRIRAEHLDWPNTRIGFEDVYDRSGETFLHMYVHDPVRKMANAALQKLKEKNYKSVKEILEKLASEQGGKEIASEIQAHNRSNRNKPKDYEKLLDAIYKDNPKIGHKELDKTLHKYVGDGVIQRIDNSLGEIVLTDGRTFKLSGLKDQINRRRNLL